MAGEGRALVRSIPARCGVRRYNHLVLARSQIQEVFPLAACSRLAENSRLGFGPVASTSRWASGFSISSSTLSFRATLYDGRVRPRSTGKERDTESGNDYFGARYYASTMGRFMSPDWAIKVAPVPYAKLSDPQTLNLYAYVLNNPLSHRDADGHWIELTGNDAARKKQLDALKTGVGSKAGGYLYDNTVGGKHYVGILSGGADGKGPSFGSINSNSEKIGDIAGDTKRGAVIQFEKPGTEIRGAALGPAGDFSTPARTTVSPNSATIHLTSGPLGETNGNLSSDGHSLGNSLADVLTHELGHVDSTWYHGGMDTNGDSVRTENTTRQFEGGATRTGHDDAGDVRLGGTTF